jgi:hypothetical protein
MELREDIRLINERLEDIYGKNVELNLPKFRIVWSEYTEKRFGQFVRFSEEGIFLHTEEGVFEEPKYVGFCSEKWVLEELKDTIGNPYLQDIVKYSYEPVWVFGSANSNPNPIWRAVNLLVQIRLKGDPNKPIIRNKDDVDKLEAKQYAAEKARAKDILKNERPNFAGNAASVVDGDAVVIGNTDYLVQDKGQANGTESV